MSAESERRLDQLLRGPEPASRARNAPSLEVGVNLNHGEAARTFKQGFKAHFIGVAIHSPDGPAYHRPELTVLDDWR